VLSKKSVIQSTAGQIFFTVLKQSFHTSDPVQGMVGAGSFTYRQIYFPLPPATHESTVGRIQA